MGRVTETSREAGMTASVVRLYPDDSDGEPPTPETTNGTNRNTMTTVLMETLTAGDVIEVRTVEDVKTVLVLLATDDFVILDPCDDSTPFVVQRDELVEYRKFDAG